MTGDVVVGRADGCHSVDVKTRTRLAALVVSCAAALSLTGATASAQTQAQRPALGTLIGPLGCARVLVVPHKQPGAAEVAGCFWGVDGQHPRPAAIVATFDSTQDLETWLTWNHYPSGQMIAGSGWAAVTTQPDATALVVGRLGGTVR